MSRIMAYCTGLVEISRSLCIRVKVSTAPKKINMNRSLIHAFPQYITEFKQRVIFERTVGPTSLLLKQILFLMAVTYFWRFDLCS